ncbi:MAG: chorismate mutase [Verrucomicrobiales bacterium]|jgi:chorismate mutase
MKNSPKLKLLLGIITIFLLGGVAGGLVGSRLGKEAVEKRSKIENLNQNIMAYLEDRLSLTTEQVAIIQPMVGQACEELEGIHLEGAERIEKVIRRYHELIAKTLDSDQLPILKEMERKRREQAGHKD